MASTSALADTSRLISLAARFPGQHKRQCARRHSDLDDLAATSGPSVRLSVAKTPASGFRALLLEMGANRLLEMLRNVLHRTRLSMPAKSRGLTAARSCHADHQGRRRR